MKRYSLSDFAEVPVIRANESAVVGDISEIPDIAVFGAEVNWHEDLVDLWETQLPDDRSTALMEAAYLAAEDQWTDAQILSLLYSLDERWKKYTSRPAAVRDKLLRDLLERARVKVGYEGRTLIEPGGFLEQHSETIIDETDVLGFNDFLKRSYPIDWMLDGLLAHSGAGLITGWPGAGKTTLSLQMAASLALGKDFLHWPCTGTARVLYLSLEMAAPPLHLFVSSSKENYSKAELKQLNENLLLAPFGVPLHVDRKEGYERLTHLLEKYRPDVVFIDSLSMITPKDLTDEEAMKTLFDGLAVIRQETNTAFIVIHHNRKKAADAQKNKRVEQSDIYGSTYITAKVDFAVNLTKMEEKNVVQLDVLKNRLGVEPDPFELMRTGMKFYDPSSMAGFLADMK